MVQIPPEVAVGILTAGSALAGAYLQSRTNLKAQQQSIEAQNKRASADYVLQKEADALMELLEDAERCHTLAQQYHSRASTEGEIDDEFTKNVNNALADFEASVRTKTIFLEEEDYEKVKELLGSVRTAIYSGDELIRGRDQIAHEINDWEKLITDFRDLQDMLREIHRERIDDLRH